MISNKNDIESNQHQPHTDLKYLFRNFVSIIMFCVDQAEREMKEEKEKKMKEKL